MEEKIIITMNKAEFSQLIQEAVAAELSKKKQKELLNFKEARELLGISASALNTWKSQNIIPYKRLGKRIFFSRQELLDALKNSNYLKIKEIK
jgi:hypothetical protein